MRMHPNHRGETVGILRVALACPIVWAGASYAEAAGSLHFNQSDVDLGELLTGAMPTQDLTLQRGSNGNAQSTVTYSAGLTLGGTAVMGNVVKATGNSDPVAGALTVTLADTTTPGAANWTVQLDDATPGEDDLVALSATILAHANGSFDGSLDQNVLDIDFGPVAQGTTQTRILTLFNLPDPAGAGLTADLDLDTFSKSGDVEGKFSTDLAEATFVAGQSGSYSITLDTSTAGTYAAQFILNLSDEDLEGEQNQILLINVLGNVALIPEPSSLALLGSGGLLLSRRRR